MNFRNPANMTIEHKSNKERRLFSSKAIILWLIFFCPVGLWIMYRHSNWSKATKRIGLAATIALFVAGCIGIVVTSPPSIDIASATAPTRDGTYDLVATISPTDSTVTVNGKVVATNHGKLDVPEPLQEGDNFFTVRAQSAKKITTQVYTVHRFTKAEMAAQDAAAAKAKANAIAKQDAANAAKAQKAVADAAAQKQVQSNDIGSRTKTTSCQVTADQEQDKACTPGAVFTNVTADMVCKTGYSSSVRDVSSSTKSTVYSEYGIKSHTTGQYEVDHLIPLELGGSNSIANLWPEAASPTPGFHQKDEIENKLHDEVCSGQMNLADAQKRIANDWISIYLAFYPASSAPSMTITPGTGPTMTTSPAPQPTDTTVTPSPVAPPPQPSSDSVYFANCTDARAAGAAPIYIGQPGYRPALDRDGDGVACE